MSTELVRQNRSTARQFSETLVDRCRQGVAEQLDQLRDGQLELHENGSRWVCGEVGSLHAELTIDDASAWVDIALGGSIGAAESYMDGHWHSRDLTSLIQLFARNLDALDRIESKQRWWNQATRKLAHWWYDNSRQGAKRNIARHYDLGNDMFKLWLDPLMMYSSAIYPHTNASLEQAAEYKLRRIAEKLKIKATDQVLEIGTGWGGLSIFLARNYGCHVTTTTISREQYDEAKARIEALGFQDKITLLLQDYRELQGQFDKLVSIEMIEAVGLKYLPEYFRKCSSLLKPDGAFLLQSITIADQRYDYAASNVDFIQKYIFPGGALPSNSRIAECLRDDTDMMLMHHEDIGQHYARTLRDWRQRFLSNKEAILAQGYDQRFLRMWEYYLCYCEGGFLERTISCAQLLMHKPRCRDLVSGLQ